MPKYKPAWPIPKEGEMPEWVPLVPPQPEDRQEKELPRIYPPGIGPDGNPISDPRQEPQNPKETDPITIEYFKNKGREK